MNIVVDTNVFISALIKDGTTRKIIINSEYNFLFPEFEFYEIKKHKLDILQKSGLPEKELNILLLRLLNSVKIKKTFLSYHTLKCVVCSLGFLDAQKSETQNRKYIFKYVVSISDIIPADIIIKFRKEALDIIGEIDPDDAQFVATALAFNAVIWSDDKHFQQQNKIKVLTTKDIVDFTG